MPSTRIAVLDLVRVIGMIFVMLIHSPAGPDGDSSRCIHFIKTFVASGAVPVFFLLSGYLGAPKFHSPTFGIRDHWNDKFRTWIVPFLFWNALMILLVLAFKSSGWAAGMRRSGAYLDVEPTLSSVVPALLGIGRSPIVYQFWFLRDLIVVSFVALALCRLLKHLWLLPWIFFFLPWPMASSLGYYLLGHQLRGVLPVERFPSPLHALLYCGVWLVMALGVFLHPMEIPSPLQQLASAAFIFMLAILLAHSRMGIPLASLGSATFFVYATHEPLQSILGKVWEAAHLPLYHTPLPFALIPAVVFIVCTLGYFGLSKAVPRLMSIATGHRQWSPSRERAATP